jgi:excisionase family DNA binding protein
VYGAIEGASWTVLENVTSVAKKRADRCNGHRGVLTVSMVCMNLFKHSIDDADTPVEVMYLTYAQAARVTSTSVSAVKKRVREGKLPVARFGRSARIPVDSLRNFGQEGK